MIMMVAMMLVMMIAMVIVTVMMMINRHGESVVPMKLTENKSDAHGETT